jgi:adenylate kinase family enzyme
VRYRRIHLLGGSGSGKTYLAAKIDSAFGIPTHDLDELFWDNAAANYETRADSIQRDRALAALVEQDTWVIEGVWYKWVAPSFERADLIILLTPPVWLRQWRIIHRFVRRRLQRSTAKKKETLGSLVRLLRWNQGYDQRVLVPARAMLAQLNKRVVECQTLPEVFVVLTETSPDLPRDLGR